MLRRIVKLNAEAKNFDAVMATLRENANFFSAIPKAKTAKMIFFIIKLF